MDYDALILVDSENRELGSEAKLTCHLGDGLLHRAFSIFIFDNQGRLLIHQRSPKKMLWGGYWTNSCCSHPASGEDLTTATARRLQQELGLSGVALEELFAFEYQARFGEIGSEHEYCHVFFGRCDAEPVVDPDEISDLAWVTWSDLKARIAADPDRFTPWFKLELARLERDFAETLACYTSQAS